MDGCPTEKSLTSLFVKMGGRETTLCSGGPRYGRRGEESLQEFLGANDEIMRHSPPRGSKWIDGRRRMSIKGEKGERNTSFPFKSRLFISFPCCYLNLFFSAKRAKLNGIE